MKSNTRRYGMRQATIKALQSYAKNTAYSNNTFVAEQYFLRGIIDGIDSRTLGHAAIMLTGAGFDTLYVRDILQGKF